MELKNIKINYKINDINSKISFDNILNKIFLFKKDNTKYKNNNKRDIHIVMSLNEFGIYPTLISMVSALENNNKDKNILVYYLLLSHDFNASKINIFESLKENYELRLNYYIIPNFFKYNKNWRGQVSNYFVI